MEDNTKNSQQNSPAQCTTNENRIQPDGATINDSKANVANDNLLQGGLGRERLPEFGDDTDPTSEEFGRHHRDE